MLSKLIKHEFKATSRFMWVIYVAMLALSVGANVSIRLLDRGTTSRVLAGIAVTLMVVWVLALIIGMTLTIVLLVKQFHKNLLTDEGYLMFTLPASVHHLVLSKLITAVVWMMVTVVVLLLSVMVAVFENAMLRDFVDFMRNLFDAMTVRYALNGTVIVLEILAALFVGIACSCLQFYSAMAIGYGFNSHKALWSVVVYFGISFVIQLISTVVLAATDFLSPVVTVVDGMHLTAMKLWHLTMLSSIGVSLVLCAVFYIITVVNLQKRLNLS